MARVQGWFLVAVLVLFSHSSVLTDCPGSCTCQRGPLLNCTSSGLLHAPQPIRDTITDLDLSHNLLTFFDIHQPHQNLRSVWLSDNRITHLSLCIDWTVETRPEGTGGPHCLRCRSRNRCISWAPTLQLLSAERNQLAEVPQGLGGSRMLQVLQLSSNNISTLGPRDLNHLHKLKELHLQHNHITSLHPNTFRDLIHLKILDLSFNMLTTLDPLTYRFLRNIGANVNLNGNRWHCDCSMLDLQRQMGFDSDGGLQPWSVVCSSPPALTGRHLLWLAQDDLSCFNAENRSGHYQDVRVYRGSEVLLTCSTKESLWWTPSGQATVGEHQVGLWIRKVGEREAGLYVCVSESEQDVSVFNLQIRKTEAPKRRARGLSRSHDIIIPQDTLVESGHLRSAGASQSELALAVSLSVIITFLVAFILGVLARPLIEVLWRRLFSKTNTYETNTPLPEEESHYENVAFSSDEEPGIIQPHRERRVTFSDVQYYDTVAIANEDIANGDALASAESGSNTANISKANTETDNKIQQSLADHNPTDGRNISGVLDPGHPHEIEYENISNAASLEKTSLSSHSNSEGQVKQEEPSKSPKLPEDGSQHRVNCSVESPTVPTVTHTRVQETSIHSTSEIPDTAPEPFADWVPHVNNTCSIDPDLWPENGENFDFSDSIGSASVMSGSVFGSFNNAKLVGVSSPEKLKKSERSSLSSSSYVSEDEPTQYTVNPEQEDGDARTFTDESIPQNSASPREQLNHFDSSLSSDNDDKHSQSLFPTEMSRLSLTESQTVNTDLVRRWPTIDLDDITLISKGLEIKPQSPISSLPSSTESADETRDHFGVSEGVNVGVPVFPSKEAPTLSGELKTQQPPKDLCDISPAKRQAPLPPSLSAAVTQSKADELENRFPGVDIGLDVKPRSPSKSPSSSSESSDETSAQTEQRKTGACILPLKQAQTVRKRRAPSPPFDLGNVIQVREHSDIRATSPTTDTSSSDESTHKLTERMKGRDPSPPCSVDIPRSSVTKRSQPTVDVSSMTHVKRHLNIKAPSPSSDTSSEESVKETAMHRGKGEPDKSFTQEVNQLNKHVGKWLNIKVKPDSSPSSESADETTVGVNMEDEWKTAPTSTSSKESQETNWPSGGVVSVAPVNRRLDIKAPLPQSCDSLCSGVNANEEADQKETGGDVGISLVALQDLQSVFYDSNTQWPAVNLHQSTPAMRHVEIKAPAPTSDSYSSDDASDDIKDKIETQEEVNLSNISPTQSPTVNCEEEEKWPTVDFDHITPVRRRLDFKAQQPLHESLIRTENEDETIHHVQEQSHVINCRAGHPSKECKTLSQELGTQWPTLVPLHIPCVRKHLNIRAASPSTDSSPSDESSDERHVHTGKLEQARIEQPSVSFSQSETLIPKSDTKWPSVDVGPISVVKRRLDIQVPSANPDSSTSDDSANETAVHSERQTESVLSKWPPLKVGPITHVKKQLDIKASSPLPVSSSESADDTAYHREELEQGQERTSMPPLKESNAVREDLISQWHAVDLSQITDVKRRLDIQAPSCPSETSSSEESDIETAVHKGSKCTSKEVGHITHVKKRLDIKAPSPPPDSSSSSESAEETTCQRVGIEQGKAGTSAPPLKQQEVVGYDSSLEWPTINLRDIPHVKRRLDIKGPSCPSDSSSSDENAEETEGCISKQGQYQSIMTEPETKWPIVDIGHIAQVKRRLDIRAPSPDHDSAEVTYHMQEQASRTSLSESSSSSDEGHKADTSITKVKLEGISHVRKTLDIKPTSLHLSQAQKCGFSPSKSTEGTYDMCQGKNPITTTEMKNSTTAESSRPVVTPNLLSQWATLTLGVSRFRKRRDISSPREKPPDIPLSPPPESSSSSNSESDEHTTRTVSKNRLNELGKETERGTSIGGSEEVKARPRRYLNIKVKEQVPSTTPSQQLLSYSTKNEGISTEHVNQGWWRRSRNPQINATSLSSKMTGDSESEGSHLSLKNIPYVKKTLDIKAPVQCNSSSDTENETVDHVQIKRERAVPHIKRHLNIIALSQQLPHSSLSHSESGNLSGLRHTKPQAGHQQLHKKVQKTTKSSSSSSDEATAHQATQRQKDVEDSHGMQMASLHSGEQTTGLVTSYSKKTDTTRQTSGKSLWRNIGHLSDFPVHSSMTQLNISSKETVVGASASEDQMERKGLNALKILSSERRRWDTDEEKGKSAMWDDDSPPFLPSSNYSRTTENDMMPLVKQSLPELLLSSSYNRKPIIIKDIYPTMDAPPPPPDMPPPEDI